jgi:hypothetical protein
MLEQPGLFPEPERKPLPRPKRRAVDPARAAKPVWSRYSAVSRMPCDHCKLAQHEGSQTEPARQARYKRKFGSSDELLCYDHASQQRELDGLAELPKGHK